MLGSNKREKNMGLKNLSDEKLEQMIEEYLALLNQLMEEQKRRVAQDGFDNSIERLLFTFEEMKSISSDERRRSS